MGNLLSPPKDTVVLVPPRISTRGLTRPVNFESPMRVQFGNLFRQEVLYDLHSFDGSVGVDVLVAPETPPKVAAHFNVSGGSDSKTISGGFLSLFFNQELSQHVHGWGRLSIDQTSGLLGNTMVTCKTPHGGCAFTITSTPNQGSRVGIRGSYRTVEAGLETVTNLSELKSTKAFSTLIPNSSYWVFSRIGESISLGFSGDLADQTRVASISLDGHIAGTDSRYCVSAETDLLAPGSVKVGFSQHLVTHRSVYNPFEDKRVKFIANYIDLALEAQTTPSGSSAIAAGVSWQPNKNLLLKIHASTEKGALATLCARNWWIPSVLVSASAGVDKSGKPSVGMRFQVSNWLTVAEYEKGRPVSSLPSTRWVSIEDKGRLDLGNRLE